MYIGFVSSARLCRRPHWLVSGRPARRSRGRKCEAGDYGLADLARRICVMRLIEPPPSTKRANSKLKNGARFRGCKPKFLDRLWRPFALLSLFQCTGVGRETFHRRVSRQALVASALLPVACFSAGKAQIFRPPKFLDRRRGPFALPSLLPMYWRWTGNSSSLCFASSSCGVCIVARWLFFCVRRISADEITRSSQTLLRSD